MDSVGIVSRANLVQTLATDRLQFFDHAEKDKTVRETVMSRIHGFRQTGSTVDVTVDHGTVNLWGVVHNEEERNTIRVATEGVPGVRKVNDHLRIFSG